MSVGSTYLADACIAVIGDGAVGSVIAYRLAQAGADVSIVEGSFPGSGTTGNSFAWLNSFGKTPRDYHRLNARSIRKHQDLAGELEGKWVHAGVDQVGSTTQMVIAASESKKRSGNSTAGGIG